MTAGLTGGGGVFALSLEVLLGALRLFDVLVLGAAVGFCFVCTDGPALSVLLFVVVVAAVLVAVSVGGGAGSLCGAARRVEASAMVANAVERMRRRGSIMFSPTADFVRRCLDGVLTMGHRALLSARSCRFP
jgi:hypothetical protein